MQFIFGAFITIFGKILNELRVLVNIVNFLKKESPWKKSPLKFTLQEIRIVTEPLYGILQFIKCMLNFKLADNKNPLVISVLKGIDAITKSSIEQIMKNIEAKSKGDIIGNCVWHLCHSILIWRGRELKTRFAYASIVTFVSMLKD